MGGPRALGLVVLLLTTGLAGCLATEETVDPASTEPVGLSETRFEALPAETAWIESSSDQAEMFAKLWRPDAPASWRAPVILVMTPYQGYDGREDPADPASPPSNPDYAWLIDTFVPRGYAVVFLDVRGTGESGGCLEQTGEQQRQDGYDAVQWLAEQPWSNGKVGMYGRSYRAETQIGTAVLAPPGLATIVPVASVSGQYEWNYYDGVPFTLHTLTGNAGYAASEGVQPPTTVEGLAQYPDRWSCQPEMLTVDPGHTGDWSPYWQERELRDLVHRIDGTSVLYVHGLQDWNVRQVAIRDMWDRFPTEKRAIFGQWSHAFPDNGYDDEPARDDWRTIVHAWYDHHLLGRENGILDRLPPVQVQDDQGAWRAETTWPPADAEAVSFHLGLGELVRDDPGELDPPLTFRENDEAFLRNNTPAPVPDADTGEVATQLVFESQALSEELRISGWPTLTLDLELFDGLYPDPDEEIDGHVAANLYVVGEDGQDRWLNSGYLSVRHKDGLDDPKPVAEDERVVYELRFHPQDSVIEAGSQLRLVISASDRWTEVQGSFYGANLYDGRLDLPVIERDLASTSLEVPLTIP